MGVLPLEFPAGTTRRTLGLTGDETFTVRGLDRIAPLSSVDCVIARADGSTITVVMRARIDTAVEADWYRHGGVLNFVLLELLAAT
jgi:aconitate hydratase